MHHLESLPLPLKQYFSSTGKYFANVPKYHSLNPAMKRLKQGFIDASPESIGDSNQWAIKIDNMVGKRDECQKDLEQFLATIKQMITPFIGVEAIIEKCCIMMNGVTYPIRVELQYEGKEKIVYIKRYASNRIIGLEIYEMIANVNGYNFATADDWIIEQHVIGHHRIPGHPWQQYINNSTYPANEILKDVIAVFMDVKDLYKPVNTLITPDGNVIIIDFEGIAEPYSKEELEEFQQHVISLLGINQENYKQLYQQQSLYLQNQIQKQNHNLRNFLQVLRQCQNQFILDFATRIEERLSQINS